MHSSVDHVLNDLIVLALRAGVTFCSRRILRCRAHTLMHHLHVLVHRLLVEKRLHGFRRVRVVATDEGEGNGGERGYEAEDEEEERVVAAPAVMHAGSHTQQLDQEAGSEVAEGLEASARGIAITEPNM